jgi:hypothetical protein
VNESLVKYLAGLLDADGSLSFTFRRCTKQDRYHLGLSLSLSASDEVDRNGFVDSLPELTGMGGVSRYGKSNQFKTWKVAKRAHLEMLLPRIIKHMVIKAQHWQWLLVCWRSLRGAPYGESGMSLEDMESYKAASKYSRSNNVGPIKPKNHPTWAWLAGYLDGDGWYTNRYSTSQNYQQMSVHAVAHINDVSVLEFLESTFGGSIHQHNPTESCRVWRRNLGVKDASFALRFLPKVAKHSRLKRHKIDSMIHFHRQRLSELGATAQATV